MACSIPTITNNQPSQLYEQLLEIAHSPELTQEQVEEKARGYYNYMTDVDEESSMANKFGNFKEIYDLSLKSKDDPRVIEMSKRVDDNFEPKLFHNKKLNKYYFLDKNGERTLFPPYTGLNTIFTTNQIKEFAKMIALDHYLSGNKMPLSDFIDKEIDRISINLSKSSKLLPKIISKKLKLTKTLIPAWETEVKNFLSSLQLNLIEKQLDIPTLQEEDFRGEAWRQSSYEKSYKSNISDDIKLFLSTFKSDEKNIFGQKKYVPFDDIFATLNKVLSNTVAVPKDNGIENEFDVYMEKIQSLSSIKPYFKDVYDALSKVDKNKQRAFVSAFRLHKNNFLGSEVSVEKNRDGRTITYSVKNLSEVGSRKSNILLQWLFNFEQKEPNLKEFYRIFESKPRSIVRKTLKVKKEKDYKKLVDTLRKDLLKLGISTTEKGINMYLNDLTTKKLPLQQRLNNIVATYNSIKYALEEASKNKDTNIFGFQSAFKDIAEAEAFFMEETSDASIFTVGKTKWAYSNPSLLSMKIEQWKKDPMLLYKHYMSNKFHMNSVYMKYLLTLDSNNQIEDIELAKERIEKMELFIFNSVQEEGNSIDAADNTDISYKDSLVDYVNKILLPKSIKKTALAAGVSTEFQIHYGVPLLQSKPTIENEKIVDLSNEVVDVIYNYVKAEWSRIQQAYEEIKVGDNLIPMYHTGQANAIKFQLMPSLNEDSRFFDINNNPKENINIDDFAEDIRNRIKGKLIDKINNTYSLLKQQHLFEVINGEFINNNIDSNIIENYKGYNNNKGLAIAADVTVDSIISQVEYSKMFTGDIAYYKNAVDYRKRAKASYTDGLYLTIEPGEELFNVSVIQSVEIPEPSIENMKQYLPEKVVKAYLNTNATDAQAWITPERWEFIIKRLGKWTDMHDEVLRKMNSTKESFTTKELKLVAQPLKGVYFDVNNGRPVYLKYSQAVLIPSLIKNTDLQRVYEAMTMSEPDESGKRETLPYKEQIHELVTRDGIKVGYHEPIVAHTPSGNVVDNLVLDNSIQLNNTSWKLQQDLPVKGFKDTDIGTQIQKNIYQGLAFNVYEDVQFDINEDKQGLSADDTIKLLNSTVEALGDKAVSSISKELGIDKDFKINNEEALYDAITEQLIKRQDVPKNILDAFLNMSSPYAVPGGLDLFQNVFSSIINNRIVKLKTNGGSFIQMADYGLTQAEALDQGVKFSPKFDKDRLPAPEIVDNKLKPGGIFISGEFLTPYIPNWKSLSEEELFSRIDNEILENLIGYRIPNQGLPSIDSLQVLGILPEGVGDTIVAYAGITTKTGSDFDIDKMYIMMPSFEVESEGMYKNANKFIRAKKITQDEMITSLMSLNIDPTLDYEILKDVYISNVLFKNNVDSDYYDEFHTEFKNTDAKIKYIKPDYSIPAHEQSKEQLQNSIIEIYKSVILNKANIAKVMQPLDTDLMERDILNLTEEEELGDLDVFDALSSIKTQSQYRSAKQGLGQAVNYTMDFVRNSMADTQIDEFHISNPKDIKIWGNVKNQVLLDQEFSESLSNKELTLYVKDYISKLNEEELQEFFNLIEVSNEQEAIQHYIDNYKRIPLADALIAITNGFVDVENKPFIINGNWVTQTNNLALMMVRSGVHLFRINAFLNIPLIKEWVEYQAYTESVSNLEKIEYPKLQFRIDKRAEKLNNEKIILNDKTFNKGDLFKTFYTAKEYNTFLRKEEEENVARKELEFRASKILGITRSEIKDNEDAVNDLVDFILKEIENTFFNKITEDFTQLDIDVLRSKMTEDQQWNALERYYELTITAKTLSASVGASRIDVDGKGKDINSLIIAFNKINDLLKKNNQPLQITNFGSKLYYDNKRTPLGVAIDNGLIFSYKIMQNNPKYFLQANNSFINAANLISNHIYNEDITNEKLLKRISTAHYTYIMSGFKPFNLNNAEKTRLITQLPLTFIEMQRKYPDNKLLSELYLKRSELGRGKRKVISMSNVKKSVYTKNEISDSFRDLLKSEKEFAEDLIKYAYLTSGFNNSINQFHEFIPYEWLNEQGINSYLKAVELEEYNLDMDFVSQFFRNNSDLKAFVSNVYSKQKKKIEDLPIDYDIPQSNAFKLDSVKDNETPPFLLKQTSYVNMMPSTSFYQYVSSTDLNEPIYMPLSELGFKDKFGNRIFEYNKQSINGYRKSLFGSNNGPLKTGRLDVEIYEDIKEVTDYSMMLANSSSTVLDVNEGLDYYLELERENKLGTPIFKKEC